MTVPFELAPKAKRAKDEPCCEPVVYPDVEREQALRMARIAKALGDPVRLQLVDVLRKHAGKVCVYELLPLFELSQPTLSHHLKKLRDAGIVDVGRRSLFDVCVLSRGVPSLEAMTHPQQERCDAK